MNEGEPGREPKEAPLFRLQEVQDDNGRTTFFIVEGDNKPAEDIIYFLNLLRGRTDDAESLMIEVDPLNKGLGSDSEHVQALRQTAERALGVLQAREFQEDARALQEKTRQLKKELGV